MEEDFHKWERRKGRIWLASFVIQLILMGILIGKMCL